MSAWTRTEWRVAEAGVLLVYVTLIGLLLRWTWPNAPWYAWALVWLFATKWTLTLVTDAVTDAVLGRHP